MTMDENLLGYALGALDDDERLRVDAELRQSPELERELEQARQWLEPLALDDEPIEPPADLCKRTLARIAKVREAELPRVVTMDDNLLGYALGALDDDERLKVDAELRQSPELECELEQARQWLEPLAWDGEPIEPPADLCKRTLARIAELREAELPRVAGKLPRHWSSSRTWYRRVDVAVAAGIVLCLLVLLPSALNEVRYQYDKQVCQNSLRSWWNGLKGYGETHNGQLPDVANLVDQDKQAAGVFVAALQDQQSVPQGTSIGCPATAIRRLPAATLDDVRRMTPDQFKAYIQQLQLGLAYSLGYADGTGIRGLRFQSDGNNGYIPVMADWPTTTVMVGDLSNSPNHGGFGQNILYLDGHCIFSTVRTAGVNGDDIYVNLARQVAAGKNVWDAVLAAPAARP
jgi:anti-sigma-K factor RskA